MNDNGDDFFDGDDEFDVLRVHEGKEDGLELEPSIKSGRRRSDYFRDYRSRPEVIERARLKKQLGNKKLSSACIPFLTPIVYDKIYLHSIQNADDEEDHFSSEEEKQQRVEKNLLSREKRTAYMRAYV
jgi:hypothetical protein